MTENLILVVDYEKICRLCLQATGAMSDLFEENGGNSLKDMVHHAIGLEVQENDGYPSKICHRCRYIVELNCEMREMVAKTNSLLQSASDKVECLEDQEIAETPTHHPKIKSSNSSMVHEISSQEIINQENFETFNKHEPGNDVDWKQESSDMHVKRDEEIKVSTKSRKVLPKHLTCQICLITFSSTEYLGTHVNTHYTDSKLTPYLKLQRPYKCEVCKRTMSKPKLISHHRNHLNVNPFVCRHAGCGFIGKNQDSLRRHRYTHAARSQVCEVCGAAYKRRVDLRMHTLRAHRATPAHCRFCKKRFRNAVTLKAHQLQYHKPRKYKCDWAGCNKAYHTPGSLAVHARTHTDEREFRCDLCSAAAYTSRSSLNRHLRMHERCRISKCDKCSATFSDYGSFYKHRIDSHGQWQPYRCDGCQKRYQTKENLEKHMEVCNQGMATNCISNATETHMIQFNENTQQQQFYSTIQEIIVSEPDRAMQLDGAISVDLLDKFKGQSLLVQPGNISELSKDLVLQDLPPDGLLYIEVDSDTDEVTWKH